MKIRLNNKRAMVLALVFLVGVSSLGANRGIADWIYADSSEFEYDISAGSYRAISFSSPYADRLFLFEFQVTSGNDISFWICDEENYWKFKADDPYSRYNALEKVGSGYVEFEITPSDVDIEWYAVFSNEYSTFTSKHVSIDITRYKWMTPPQLSLEAQLDDWEAAAVGDIIDISYTVENMGDLDAEGVEVSVDLPYGLSATQTSEYIGTLEGHYYFSDWFSIHCNEPGTYRVTVYVSTDNTGDIMQELTVQVLSPPKLSMTAILADSNIEEGEATTLTVAVANTGETSAEDVEITINIPSGLSAISTTRPLYTIQDTGQTIFTISGIQSGTYTISIICNAENADSMQDTVQLVVKEAPKPESTTAVVTKKTTITTSIESKPPESTTQALATVTVTQEQEGGFVPGFEFIIVVLALPILASWRHRQQKR